MVKNTLRKYQEFTGKIQRHKNIKKIKISQALDMFYNIFRIFQHLPSIIHTV